MAKHALADVNGFVSRGKEIFRFDPRCLVVEDGFNPRDGFGDDKDQELKANIAENGVIEPLIVQKRADGTIVIRNGGRRHWACMELIREGIDIVSVPVVLTDRNTSPANALYLALNTNTGKPLTAVEEARAMQRLVNHGQTAKDIALKLGRSKVFVYERLKLVNASKATVDAMKKGEISIRDAANATARSMGDEDRQRAAVTKIVKNKQKERVAVRWDKRTERFAVKGAKSSDQKDFLEGLFNSAQANSLRYLGLDPTTLVVRIYPAEKE